MNRKLNLSYVLILGVSLLLALFGWVKNARADLEAQEGDLNPAGSAYEINLDEQGVFWISDFDAGEIWAVDSTSGAYSVYPVGGAPSDARRDAAGFVWWADGELARFGRLNPLNGQVSLWSVPGTTSLYGTQVDGTGNFWALAADNPYLYRFNPGLSQLCSYQLPENGRAGYPLIQAGFVWLGDQANRRIVRLDPEQFEFTTWDLPGESMPEGMVFDYAGTLWWADSGLGQLSRFWPDTSQLDNYDLPTGFLPQMATASGATIWYSEGWDNAIGRLNWSMADRTTVTLSPIVSPTTSGCGTISPVSTKTIISSTGNLSWVTRSYFLLANSNGWLVYDLPVGASPWGIVAGSDAIWFVDNGRQVLGRIPQDIPATITACKVEDADGDLATSNDRDPVPDWPVSLWVEGVQVDSQLTGVNGCYTWVEQLPGYSYLVKEGARAGWAALTPTSHDFGLAGPGEQLSHTFVNAQIQGAQAVYLPLVIR